MDDVIVAGVGMHQFGRFPDQSLKDLVRGAVLRALDDAGLGIKDINAVYSANAMAGLLQGQEQIRGQSALRDIGIERIPILNVENACASGSSAFREGVMALRAGAANTVLVVGFEKMFVGDRDLSLTALESAADLDVVGGLGLQFTAVYAMRLRSRLDDGSLQPHHLIDVAVKNHANGSRNPYAQHQKQLTAADVEGSRMIAKPLRLLMCSSICDGAAAVVLTNGYSPPARPKIKVRASAAASGFSRLSTSEPSTVSVCAQAAYREASAGPSDIDVAEVHDAMAPGELLLYEQLGLCPPGEGGSFLDSGSTQLNGKMPVNPSGGLSARGHPVGATGLAQIAELVWQLRGEAATRQVNRPTLALAQNSGGWLESEPAACNIHLLERLQAWN